MQHRFSSVATAGTKSSREHGISPGVQCRTHRDRTAIATRAGVGEVRAPATKATTTSREHGISPGIQCLTHRDRTAVATRAAGDGDTAVCAYAAHAST